MPDHWQYAFGAACRNLSDWARDFDFDRDRRGATYADSDPHRLAGTITAFLQDPKTHHLGGHLASLRELLDEVEQRLVPAFDRGGAAGLALWQQSGQVYGQLPTEDLHANARSAADSEADAVRDWFVEGFCVSYLNAESDSLRDGGA